MQLGLLDTKHPTYLAQVKTWAEIEALYRGGDHFEAMKEVFLPMNDQEPLDTYSRRKRESSYISYIGPIVDYFVSWLFSASFDVRAKDLKTGARAVTEQFYNDFQSDVGGDINLPDFVRARTTLALVKGASHWLLELPPTDADVSTMSRGDWDAMGLGEATLRSIDREDLYDWEVSQSGKLEWANIHKLAQVRPDPRAGSRDMVLETWQIYDRQTVETFELQYEKGKRPTDPKHEVPSTGKHAHRFLELPLITLHVPDGLWIGARTRSPQIEHFRLSAAKGWLIRRTCYAMPVLNVEDPNIKPSTMGAGYYMVIGKDDKFSWTSPSNTPFDVISHDIANQRDEIYRVVHQMAQGLDNNADTVGRSADSKEIDTAATRIMLNAYGSIVRKAIEETMEILSDARGDLDNSWSVEGFNGYDTATSSSLIANAADAVMLGIPSKTFLCEIKTKAALSLMAGADASVRESIRQEIFAAHEHLDLEALELPTELQTKIDIAKGKDDAAIEVQKQKSETAEKIQESRAEDVRVEAQMSLGAAPTPAQAANKILTGQK